MDSSTYLLLGKLGNVCGLVSCLNLKKNTYTLLNISLWKALKFFLATLLILTFLLELAIINGYINI